MQIWNVLHAARWKYRTQKLRKKSPSVHLRTILFGPAISSRLNRVSTVGKNVKQQYLLHISSQYGEHRPTNGWDRLTCSLGHPSKFQRVSRVGFVTPPTPLNGDQPNFARCLAVSWAGTLYIHFGGSCPLTEFCQVKNSLCVQVLRSSILAALLHSTREVGVSQTLRLATRNGITNVYSLPFSTVGATYILHEGGHHVGHRPTF